MGRNLRRAWKFEDAENEAGETVSAYEQLVDHLGSMADTTRTIGGQFNVASIRVDTGETVGGIKSFVTTGYVVTYTDHVPGMPAPDADADEDQEGNE